MRIASKPGEQSERVEALYGEVGRRIREARTARDITQDGLAQAVGVTRTSITNVEAGRQKLPLHTLYEIAAALGVEAAALLPPGGREAGEAGKGRAEAELLKAPELEEMTPAERRWFMAAKRVPGRGGARGGTD